MRVAQLNAERKHMPLVMTGDEIRHAEALTKVSAGRGFTEYKRGWHSADRETRGRVV